jgi:hypothetical protein
MTANRLTLTSHLPSGDERAEGAEDAEAIQNAEIAGIAEGERPFSLRDLRDLCV